MKTYSFLSIITLGITVISCTNSNIATTGEKTDSTIIVKKDSIIPIPNTLTQKTGTISPQTTFTTTSKNNPEPTRTIQPEPPCTMPLVPRFPEGDQAMRDFIEERMQYPEAARKANISGTVLIGVRVKITGELTDIKVLKGIGYGCDEEAVRIVKLMPKWVPGKSGNKSVEADTQIPVDFKMIK
ncbi:MAG: energy transducer TonB [Bacteroidota bacterium]